MFPESVGDTPCTANPSGRLASMSPQKGPATLLFAWSGLFLAMVPASAAQAIRNLSGLGRLAKRPFAL